MVRVGIAKAGANLATPTIAVGTKVAVKCILKQGCPSALLFKEVEIMRRIGNHSGVIQLFDLYEDAETVYLILELVTGGELFDKIVTTDVYSEKMAANYIRQVVEVVAFLHEHQLVHRDLKPENLLLEDATAEKLKVCDFGLAEILDPPEDPLFMVVGSPNYMAPEVMSGGGYHKPVDMYSIGVILYTLLCGYLPIEPDAGITVLEFPSPDWDGISSQVKELIEALLEETPSKRPTAKEMLRHPWVRGENVSEKVLVGTIRNLGKFTLAKKEHVQKGNVFNLFGLNQVGAAPPPSRGSSSAIKSPAAAAKSVVKSPASITSNAKVPPKQSTVTTSDPPAHRKSDKDSRDKDKDKERDKDKDKDRDRNRDKPRDKDRERDRTRDRPRDRSRDESSRRTDSDKPRDRSRSDRESRKDDSAARGDRDGAREKDSSREKSSDRGDDSGRKATKDSSSRPRESTRSSRTSDSHHSSRRNSDRRPSSSSGHRSSSSSSRHRAAEDGSVSVSAASAPSGAATAGSKRHDSMSASGSDTAAAGRDPSSDHHRSSSSRRDHESKHRDDRARDKPRDKERRKPAESEKERAKESSGRVRASTVSY